jgi:hypothetical protein
MGYRRKTGHHAGSCIGQIRFEVIFSVHWPTSATGMHEGQKIEVISIATILQKVVRAPETENVRVLTMGPIH